PYSCTRGESHLSNRSLTAVSHYRPCSPTRGIGTIRRMPTTVRERIGNIFLELGARLLQLLERVIVRSSLVPTTPFLPVDRFPWAAELEASWKTIRTELEDVMTYRDDLPNFQDISTDQATITDDDRWKTFFFYGFGFRSDANCERCPETTRLIERVPGMTTAFFSILA